MCLHLLYIHGPSKTLSSLHCYAAHVDKHSSLTGQLILALHLVHMEIPLSIMHVLSVFPPPLSPHACLMIFDWLNQRFLNIQYLINITSFD